MNIRAIKIILPKKLNWLAIPTEIPVVPKADTASKVTKDRASWLGKGWVSASSKIAPDRITKEIKTRVRARKTFS